MFQVGDNVIGSHGKGKIVGMNHNKGLSSGAKYALNNPTVADQAISLIPVDSFYPADQYPYIVLFEDGYQDVYAETDLQPTEE